MARHLPAEGNNSWGTSPILSRGHSGHVHDTVLQIKYTRRNKQHPILIFWRPSSFLSVPLTLLILGCAESSEKVKERFSIMRKGKKTPKDPKHSQVSLYDTIWSVSRQPQSWGGRPPIGWCPDGNPSSHEPLPQSVLQSTTYEKDPTGKA